ncbi:hypothetical protein PTKIN_Ptkin16aG0010300 [Pterospermum kingtungense]
MVVNLGSDDDVKFKDEDDCYVISVEMDLEKMKSLQDDSLRFVESFSLITDSYHQVDHGSMLTEVELNGGERVMDSQISSLMSDEMEVVKDPFKECFNERFNEGCEWALSMNWALEVFDGKKSCNGLEILSSSTGPLTDLPMLGNISTSGLGNVFSPNLVARWGRRVPCRKNGSHRGRKKRKTRNAVAEIMLIGKEAEIVSSDSISDEDIEFMNSVICREVGITLVSSNELGLKFRWVDDSMMDVFLRLEDAD